MRNVTVNDTKSYNFNLRRFGLVCCVETTVHEKKTESLHENFSVSENEFNHFVCLRTKYLDQMVASHPEDSRWVFSVPVEEQLVVVTQETYQCYTTGNDENERRQMKNPLLAIENGRFHLLVRKDSVNRSVMLDVDGKPISRPFDVYFEQSYFKRHGEKFMKHLEMCGCHEVTRDENGDIVGKFTPNEKQLMQVFHKNLPLESIQNYFIDTNGYR